MDIKPLLDELATYTVWADGLYVERLSAEPEAVLDRTVASSFPSLRATLLHIRDAHCAWYLRMAGLPVHWPAEEDRAIGTLLTHGRRLREQVLSATPVELLEVVRYRTLKGEPFAQPRWQAWLHAMNHATYHRGQLATMMRQLGLDGVPATDLVRFQRMGG